MKLRSTLAAHHRRQLLVLAAAVRLTDAAGEKLQAGRIDAPPDDVWTLKVAEKYEANARRPAGFLALLGSVTLLQLLLVIVVPVVRILARAASDPSNEGAAAPENLPPMTPLDVLTIVIVIATITMVLARFLDAIR